MRPSSSSGITSTSTTGAVKRISGFAVGGDSAIERGYDDESVEDRGCNLGKKRSESASVDLGVARGLSAILGATGGAVHGHEIGEEAGAGGAGESKKKWFRRG